MNSQQWPPPGGGQDSPWAHQDPGHRAPQFHDAQGRDPRRPFGEAPPPPPPPEQLRPPRPTGPVVWAVVGIIVVIAALVLGMQFVGGGSQEPQPSGSAAPSSGASPSRTGNYIPFEGNGDGIFEIVRHEWTSEGLLIRVRVEIERGEYQFGLFAFTNETREAFDALNPAPFTVRAGTPYEADVVFPMPQADSTIVLSTPSGAVALNALPVPG